MLCKSDDYVLCKLCGPAFQNSQFVVETKSRLQTVNSEERLYKAI